MSAELEVKNVVTAEQKQCHLRVRPTIYIYGQKGFVTEGVEFPMGFCKKSEANDFEFFYDPTLDRKMKNTELNLEVMLNCDYYILEI